jgi:hypothetical protein
MVSGAGRAPSDFLPSEVANFYGTPNIPGNPDLAIEVGSRLCQDLLEPLNATFGRIAVRSGYRSSAINALCNERGHNCASNEKRGENLMLAAHVR